MVRAVDGRINAGLVHELTHVGHDFRTLRTEKIIVVGFGLALAVLLGMAVLQYRTANRLVEANHWVAHTDEALTEIQGVVASTNNAESSVRGYVIIRDERLFASYSLAAVETDEHLRRLKDLVQDSVQQQRRLKSLESLVASRLNNLQDLVDLRESGGLAAAREFMATGIGLGLSNQIHDLTQAMTSNERDLLKSRTAAALKARSAASGASSLKRKRLAAIPVLSFPDMF